MDNIKVTDNNVSQAIDEDEYEDIEITNQEEIIQELKRVRRELWELERNYSGSISDRESDELFGELKELQKENKENNSKETRMFKYIKVFNIIHIFLSAFSVILAILSFVVFPQYGYSIFVDYGTINIGIPAILIFIAILSLGIGTLKPIKKKNYQFVLFLNIIISCISLLAFIFAFVGINCNFNEAQSLVILISTGTMMPFSFAVVVLSILAIIESSKKRKK